MGCINTKKLGDLRHENVFRVRAMQLQPEVPAYLRTGHLQVNERELIWTPHNNREQIAWALQHLRRYGLNLDVFSFEAGRRCASGPGIFTFRCQHADELYQLFQQYVNAVSSVSSAAGNTVDEHPSHLFLNRGEHNSHTNNYLEPAPLAVGNLRAALQDSFITTTSVEQLDSPDSVNSLTFSNEIVHFSTATTTPSTPAATYVNTSNIYMEQPCRSIAEHNNNNSSSSSSTAAFARILNGGSVSAFSTLNRKSFIAKGSSLDIPPEECAPLLNLGSAAIYTNVNCAPTGYNCIRIERERMLDASERCYENLSHLDMSLLLQASKSNMATKHTLQRNASLDQHSPTTTTTNTQVAVVNYIMLDLDQPKSPAQCSPKTCFGSGASLSTAVADTLSAQTAADVQSLPAVCMTNSKVSSKDDDNDDDAEQQHSYSTIDFVKTCALIKSTTHCSEFDHEESRLTRHSRHSKCVRKAFSISE